jgi:hypothetical protein
MAADGKPATEKDSRHFVLETVTSPFGGVIAYFITFLPLFGVIS